jgi:Tfp pilus assembly protein PilF
LEKAEEAYKKALELSAKNPTIKSNYDRFKKMLEKGKDEKNENENEKDKKDKK